MSLPKRSTSIFLLSLALPALAAESPPSSLDSIAESQVEKIVKATLEPGARSLAGDVVSPADVERLEPRLRALWAEGESRAFEVCPLDERPPFLSALRARFARVLAGSVLGPSGTPEQAEELVARLVSGHREARARNLHGSLMCWCDREDWTRTLAGCPEPCAQPQKDLIDRWLAEGLSDAEIIASMVQESVRLKGPAGVKVKASSKSLWLYVPFLILAAAGIFVVVVLRGLVRGREERKDAQPAEAETEEREWEERLEQELRQMEE